MPSNIRSIKKDVGILKKLLDFEIFLNISTKYAMMI